MSTTEVAVRGPAPAARRTRRPAPAEARSLLTVALVVLLLNAVGWGVLLLVVVPQRLAVGGGVLFGAGLGLTAFVLGARHAFDADHIAAIDNTTRKLVGEGRPAGTVGLWFSLGHSSVVFALSLLLALGLGTVAAPLTRASGAGAAALALGSAVVAGGFLLILGLVNLGALRGLLAVARRARAGELDEAALERQLNRRGILARLLRGVLARVREPRHIYPVGVLMGLGFDTASQVALLVLGGAGTSDLPWYAVLVLPVLFAAGMTLFDGTDGLLMARAYRWAFRSPGRRIRYNLLVTGISAVAALTIGGVVLLQAVAHLLDGRLPLALLTGIDLQQVGIVLAAALVATWVVATAVARSRTARRAGGGP